MARKANIHTLKVGEEVLVDGTRKIYLGIKEGDDLCLVKSLTYHWVAEVDRADIYLSPLVGNVYLGDALKDGVVEGYDEVSKEVISSSGRRIPVLDLYTPPKTFRTRDQFVVGRGDRVWIKTPKHGWRYQEIQDIVVNGRDLGVLSNDKVFPLWNIHKVGMDLEKF